MFVRITNISTKGVFTRLFLHYEFDILALRDVGSRVSVSLLFLLLVEDSCEILSFVSRTLLEARSGA